MGRGRGTGGSACGRYVILEKGVQTHFADLVNNPCRVDARPARNGSEAAAGFLFPPESSSRLPPLPAAPAPGYLGASGKLRGHAQRSLNLGAPGPGRASSSEHPFPALSSAEQVTPVQSGWVPKAKGEPSSGGGPWTGAPGPGPGTGSQHPRSPQIHPPPVPTPSGRRSPPGLARGCAAGPTPTRPATSQCRRRVGPGPVPAASKTPQTQPNQTKQKTQIKFSKNQTLAGKPGGWTWSPRT